MPRRGRSRSRTIYMKAKRAYRRYSKPRRSHPQRFPLVGFLVGVVNPFLNAAKQSGLSMSNLNIDSAQSFSSEIVTNYTGVRPTDGAFFANRLMQTYLPIITYKVAKRFVGKDISRFLKPLRMSF